MNSHATVKARPAVKPSGKKGTPGAGILRRGKAKSKAIVAVPWQMSRLRHQAVVFFAHGDPTLRRDLNRALGNKRTFSQVQSEMLHGRTSPRRWTRFLDTFFSATTNKTRRARV